MRSVEEAGHVYRLDSGKQPMLTIRLITIILKLILTAKISCPNV